MGEAFHDGGFGMIPTAIFGLMLIAAAIRYAVTPERRFVPLMTSLGVLTLSSGCFGFVRGLMQSISAVGPNQTERPIWVIGLGETSNNLALASALVAAAAMIATVGSLRVARGASQSHALP